MVKEWIQQAEGISASVLTPSTIDSIEDITGKHSLRAASDYERAEVVRRLMDLAYDVLEELHKYEPNEPTATYENVFHIIYGYRFEV